MDPDLFNMMGYSAGEGLGDLASGGPSSSPASAVDSSGNFTLPMAMQAGGSILGAIGDIMAGDEEQKAYEYNAGLALEQGQFNVKDLDQKETDTLSTQKAMYAKAGVTMTGSPTDTAIQSATQFEMSKQIATFNAQSAANMDIYEGEIAKQQGEFGAAGSLLQGGESIAMMAALM